jgi:hypothetical protein
MKRLLLALAMVGIFAATSVAADNISVKAQVPFDFTAAGTQFPAGMYSIERQSIPGVLHIRDGAGRLKAMFTVNPVYRNSDAQSPMLVFNKYGDRYFLAKVWPATGVGSLLRKTKIEKELVAAVPADQVFVAAIYR